jgi:predicted enzyme related to lactoylglutathione lyase
MPIALRHFAINADDVPRARAFYERAFGWTYTPWGPPGFYQTRTAGRSLMGALQGRRAIGGQVMPDIELSFGVDDLDETTARITAGGGQIIMAPFHIETVGSLVFFRDSEGNIAGAMQYEPGMTPAGEAPPGCARFTGFGINADDVARAKAFYEGVFGWKFSPWGPPDFFTCHDTGDGIGGLLQGRHTVADDRSEPGLSVTFGVEDIDAAMAAIRAAGGEVLSAPYYIEGVGHHVFMADTEGAVCAVMQHDPEPTP